MEWRIGQGSRSKTARAAQLGWLFSNCLLPIVFPHDSQAKGMKSSWIRVMCPTFFICLTHLQCECLINQVVLCFRGTAMNKISAFMASGFALVYFPWEAGKEEGAHWAPEDTEVSFPRSWGGEGKRGSRLSGSVTKQWWGRSSKGRNWGKTSKFSSD